MKLVRIRLHQSKYDRVKFKKEQRPRKGIWLRCETCKKEFYVYPSRLRDGNPRFCSVACYDKHGENNPFHGKKHSLETKERLVLNRPPDKGFKKGEDNPNFIRFGETSGFFGTTLAWWRNYFLKEIGKCEKCGFTDVRIIEIHHKNKDRSINTRENLMYLCPNCHSLEHWFDKSGRYKWRG